MEEERRSMALTDADFAEIESRFQRHFSLAEELHRQHHDFLAVMIEKMRARQAMAEKIKAQVGGWGVIVFLTAIGVSVFEWVRNHIGSQP